MILAIIFAYINSVHSSTGFSPFELLYGWKLILPMHVNPSKTVGAPPENFDQYAQIFIAWREKQVLQAKHNIIKAQAAQKKGHDKRIKYNHTFVLGDCVAYRKEKKCEKQGKFRAQYVGPYTVISIDEKQHKLQLRPAREGVAPIDFMVPTFDVVHCALDLSLTQINLVGKEISYVPKKT
jgi:hypothetical protein